MLGLLSLLFGILAPFAIWAGVESIYRIRTGAGNLSGENAAWVGLVAGFLGFTFTAIGIAYWLIAS